MPYVVISVRLLFVCVFGCDAVVWLHIIVASFAVAVVVVHCAVIAIAIAITIAIAVRSLYIQNTN